MTGLFVSLRVARLAMLNKVKHPYGVKVFRRFVCIRGLREAVFRGIFRCAQKDKVRRRLIYSGDDVEHGRFPSHYKRKRPALLKSY